MRLSATINSEDLSMNNKQNKQEKRENQNKQENQAKNCR